MNAMGDYYFIRTQKSYLYLKGSGMSSTPRLYTLGQAKRICKAKNKNMTEALIENNGLFQVVPVTVYILDSAAFIPE